MSSDSALYAEVPTAEELARLLPVRFQSVALGERCAYARATDPRWPASRLFALAARISATGREALVLEYDDARAAFYFARFRRGKLEREVRDEAGRRSERGLAEPWELATGEVAARAACARVGHHYRLSGWFEPAIIGASPANEAATWLRYDAAPELATTQARGPRATTLFTSLERCTFGATVDRSVFLEHPEFYVLLDRAGAPYIHTRPCKRHGEDRVLRVYTSVASVMGYLQSWEAPILGLHMSPSLDGARLLELAEAHAAGIMDFNIYGEGPGPELSSTSLSPAHCLWL